MTALAGELVRLGVPDPQALALGNTQNFLAGAGTTQGTGTQIHRTNVVLANPTGGNTAFTLPGTDMRPGGRILFFNMGSVVALVYPQSFANIDGSGTNLPISVQAGQATYLYKASATAWRQLRVDTNASATLYQYDSVSVLMSTIMPASATMVRLAGYTSAGDGGAGYYKRSTGPAAPGKVQSLDGAWWLLVMDASTNTKTFGAKADNITLDHQAIQDYSTYLKTLNGGPLNIWPDQHLVGHAVTLSSNIHVKGIYGCSRLNASAAWVTAPAIGFFSVGECFFYNENIAVSTLTDNDITIEGVSIDYSLKSKASNIAFFFRYVSNVKVLHCKGKGGADGDTRIGNLTGMVQCRNTLVHGCYAYNVFNAGLDHWGGTEASICSQNNITGATTGDSLGPGCGIQWTGGDGSSSAGALSTRFIAVGNHVTRATGIAVNCVINTGEVDLVNISNNVVTDSPSWGVFYEGAPGAAQIVNNHFARCAGACIFARQDPAGGAGGAPQSVIITGNIAEECTPGTGATSLGITKLFYIHNITDLVFDGNVARGGTYTYACEFNTVTGKVGANNILAAGSTGKHSLTSCPKLYVADWQVVASTATSSTGALTLAPASCRYWEDGTKTTFKITVAITTNGTGATAVRATLPKQASGFPAFGAGRDSTSGLLLIWWIDANGTFATMVSTAGGYPGADGRVLEISGVYDSIP